MIRTCAQLVLAAAVSGVVQTTPAQHLKANDLSFSDPIVAVTLEGDVLTGQPSRLAWAPGDQILYLQTLDGTFGRPDAKLRHFLVASDGGQLRELPAEPEWAVDYWIVKSDQASPDDPAVRITLKSESRREKTTSTPQGGDLARGGTSPVSSIGRNDAVDAAFNSQIAFMNTMMLHGQKVGEFDNTVIVPGLTFGWGPSGVIAYAEPGKGRIVVMDAEGKRTEIGGTKDARLPAWSTDNTRLAWVEKIGRNKFVVRVADVEKK